MLVEVQASSGGSPQPSHAAWEASGRRGSSPTSDSAAGIACGTSCSEVWSCSTAQQSGRSSTACGRTQSLQGRQHTAGHARGAWTNTHTLTYTTTSADTHKKLKTTCVPPWLATRSKNKFPIASCVVHKSIECNTRCKMSSAENPGKENRGLTLIPCSIWRASSSDVRYRDVLQGVGPRCHCSWLCTASKFPWTPTPRSIVVFQRTTRCRRA